MNPYEVKNKILNNLGFTDYIFEFSKNIPINTSMTDREKVRVLNRWIVDNYIYDERKAAYNFKDLVKTNYAICGGYSCLFRELGEFFGLDTESVTGSFMDGNELVYHAWNKVLIDNEWLYLDTCWNDDNPNVEEYLFLTEEEINNCHSN